LYTYAYKTYGKTFTTKNVFTENEDPNIALQRKIELEEFERMQVLFRSFEIAITKYEACI
jgi:hypothetical protein